MIGNILDNTTELYMIKYAYGEIFSSGGATLCKNPSDQTVSIIIFDGSADDMAFILNRFSKLGTNFARRIIKQRCVTHIKITGNGNEMRN